MSYIKLTFPIFLLFIWTSTSAIAQETVAKFKPQVVVVQFMPDVMVGKTQTDHSGINQLFSKYGVHSIESIYPILAYVEPTPTTRQNILDLQRTYYVHYDLQESPLKVSDDFSLDEAVVYAEPVLIHQFYHSVSMADPDDPMFSEQQVYFNHVHLPEAWSQVKSENPRNDTTVVIAIVDTGGDWDHEDLRENAWTNEDEIPNNGIDDDNNGYVDDIHGINLSNRNTMDNDPHPVDLEIMDLGHGTAVAGAASAVTDNATGMTGASWNAQLMHINVSCAEDGECDPYRGIVYAAINGADIINTSWGGATGGRELRRIRQTLDLVTDMGSLVVGATGNNGSNKDLIKTYPDGHPRVLSVGSTENDSPTLVEEFSSGGQTDFGKTVDIYAPGIQIVSTVPNHQYGKFDGTSLSAPLVAGIAALVKTNFPDISADELREQIRISYEDIDTENSSFEGKINGGLINASASLSNPTLPAVRIKNWSWEDEGDRQIDPGDEVTIKVTLINYLADAKQLSVELAPHESISFITVKDSQKSLGALNSGNSTEVEFVISADASAPPNSYAVLSLRIVDGSFHDEPDVMVLEIHPRTDLIVKPLQALYTSTDGDNWENLFLGVKWNFTPSLTLGDLIGWHGIAVVQNRVEAVVLAENNLSGVIPPELGQFPGLKLLALASNPRLTGAIPKELSGLSDLEQLTLAYNQLSGSIPPELGQISNLKSLNLQNNQLSGTIPSELGQLSKLEQLSLSENQLTGTLPMSFIQLESLKTLDISGQGLCAPTDDQFQKWIKGLDFFNGPTCTPVGIEEISENQSLPEHFVVHGNYPNPFLESTHLMFDLPWESQVHLEVIDIIGRRALTLAPITVSAGWKKSITVHSESLPSGLYLYRLIANSATEYSVQTGRFTKIRYRN